MEANSGLQSPLPPVSVPAITVSPAEVTQAKGPPESPCIMGEEISGPSQKCLFVALTFLAGKVSPSFYERIYGMLKVKSYKAGATIFLYKILDTNVLWTNLISPIIVAISDRDGIVLSELQDIRVVIICIKKKKGFINKI